MQKYPLIRRLYGIYEVLQNQNRILCFARKVYVCLNVAMKRGDTMRVREKPDVYVAMREQKTSLGVKTEGRKLAEIFTRCTEIHCLLKRNVLFIQTPIDT
jgi:hypothetical protein